MFLPGGVLCTTVSEHTARCCGYREGLHQKIPLCRASGQSECRMCQHTTGRRGCTIWRACLQGSSARPPGPDLCTLLMSDACPSACCIKSFLLTCCHVRCETILSDGACAGASTEASAPVRLSSGTTLAWSLVAAAHAILAGSSRMRDLKSLYVAVLQRSLTAQQGKCSRVRLDCAASASHHYTLQPLEGAKSS